VKPESSNEWQNAEHALSYLARADKLPHRTEGERVLLDQIPVSAVRVLDLGTGDGRTLALVKLRSPEALGVAVDFSEPMLTQAQKRFEGDPKVRLVKHDLSVPLVASEFGSFDAVVSSLALHHLTHKRKEQLFREVFNLLNPGGVFCNLDHVASPSPKAHLAFLEEISMKPENEDPSNKLLDVETQLGWLRQIGFADVDCYWKWLEVALMVGFKPKP
jgi:tRNA (cmo5U34)-methyltransferase